MKDKVYVCKITNKLVIVKKMTPKDEWQYGLMDASNKYVLDDGSGCTEHSGTNPIDFYSCYEYVGEL